VGRVGRWCGVGGGRGGGLVVFVLGVGGGGGGGGGLEKQVRVFVDMLKQLCSVAVCVCQE